MIILILCIIGGWNKYKVGYIFGFYIMFFLCIIFNWGFCLIFFD
jgi:hypothetical protein